MGRPYLSSVSSLKELLDLYLPQGFQLKILADLLRKKNCIIRWVTDAVIYIAASMFVCTKGSTIQFTFWKDAFWNQDTRQQGWMKSRAHNTSSVQYFKTSCFDLKVSLYWSWAMIEENSLQPATITAVFHWSAKQYTDSLPVLPKIFKGPSLEPSFVIY